MTKVIAYTALHYGSEYLSYAIRSVIDFIDEYHILYSPTPSHGTPSNLKCPDTKSELLAIAIEAAGNKLKWQDVKAQYEGQHRDMIYEQASDATCIVTIDSDEIWDRNTLAMLEGEMGYKGHYITIPFYHYWRSFYKAVMHDPAAPARVVFPQGQRGMHLDAGLNHAIHHFGYAQSPKTVWYKMQIHGHKNEFRHDVDWFKDVFMTNRQTDCHPVGSQFWNAEDVNPDVLLPDFMRNHPNYHKALIE